jgi:hypothetical protein
MQTLDQRYLAYLRTGMTGFADNQRTSLCHVIGWLKTEYAGELLITRVETVALAKKLLSRALDCECTKAEVEAFLRG